MATLHNYCTEFISYRYDAASSTTDFNALDEESKEHLRRTKKAGVWIIPSEPGESKWSVKRLWRA